jgi:hypothetical protein
MSCARFTRSPLGAAACVLGGLLLGCAGEDPGAGEPATEVFAAPEPAAPRPLVPGMRVMDSDDASTLDCPPVATCVVASGVCTRDPSAKDDCETMDVCARCYPDGWRPRRLPRWRARFENPRLGVN